MHSTGSIKFVGYLSIGILCIGSFFVAQAAFAQRTGLSISPVTFELTANRGESLSNVLKISNIGEDTKFVVVEVEDFRAVGERGEVTLSTGDDYTYSLSQWITVEPRTFTLGPGASQIVEFTVSVPLNAEPGGHYGSILASFSSQSGAGGATIAQKVGSLLLMKIAGNVQEEMIVKSMETPSFSEYGPVVINTRFENTGSVHLKPRGFIFIKDMFGREVAELDVKQLNVLPSSIRLIEAEFGSKWLFGKYTAQLTVIYGSENTPISYSTSFWVFPWKAGVAVGGVFFVFFILLFLMRKRIRLALKIMFRGEHLP